MDVQLDTGHVAVPGASLRLAPERFWQMFAVAFSTGQTFTVAFGANAD